MPKKLLDTAPDNPVIKNPGSSGDPRKSRVPDKISRDLMNGPELPPEERHATGEEALAEISRASEMVLRHRSRMQRMYATLTVTLLVICAAVGGWLLILARRPHEVAPQLRDDVSLAAVKVVPLADGERPAPMPMHPVAEDAEGEGVPVQPPSTRVAPPTPELDVIEIPVDGEPPPALPQVRKPAPKPHPRAAPSEVMIGTGVVNLKGKETTIILQGTKVLCAALPCTLTLPAGPHSLVALVGTTRVPLNLTVKPGENSTRLVRK